VKNGVAVTPPITDNILEGITRRTVLDLLTRELKMTVSERSIDRSEIYLADEAFYCGTGIQVAAITRVDHRPIGAGRMGPTVSALRKLYFDIVRGRVPEYRRWCAPIYAGDRDFARPDRAEDTPAASRAATPPLRVAR
jgi:branched-chain amino acid aminotransferase